MCQLKPQMISWSSMRLYSVVCTLYHKYVKHMIITKNSICKKVSSSYRGFTYNNNNNNNNNNNADDDDDNNDDDNDDDDDNDNDDDDDENCWNSNKTISLVI